MRNSVVARNYAEALLTLAEQAKAVERIGALLDAVAGAVNNDPTIQAVMMSPRVRKAEKQSILTKGLDGIAPPELIRFLGAVVQRSR